MNINKNNYESWFLDYNEGTLTAEQVAELFLFVEQHPGLKKEFESFTQIALPVSTELFTSKDSLKKNVVSEYNYTDYLVAELQGDLDLQQCILLKKFMDSHPELENERMLFSKTILPIPAEVIYPDKKKLRKHILVPTTFKTSTLCLAAAAVILLLIGVYFIQLPEKTQVADHKINSENSVGTNERTTAKANSYSLGTTEGNTSGNDSLLNKSDNVTSLTLAKGLKVEKDKLSTSNVHNAKSLKRVVSDKNIQQMNIETAMVPATLIETSLLVEIIEETPEKIILDKKDIPVISPRRSFNPLHLFDDMRTAAANKVNKATGDEIFYASSKPIVSTNYRMPLKSRIIKLVAWTVNKASNNKVKLNTDFDIDGNLASYQLSSGKFSVDKNY